MSTRIAKHMARCGACSRRDAERLIEAGRVTLNGQQVTSPVTFVEDDDTIAIDGTVVAGKQPSQLWLYHKPAGLITTNDDPEGRACVFDHLPPELPRVMSIGRLDLTSEGLLLLTNDGELARHFEHPSNEWSRQYRVRMWGFPTEAQLRDLKKGITIDGVTYRGIGVKREEGSAKGENVWAHVTLTEGKNREIRRVFAHFGHDVSRLIRVAYGPFQLGRLAPGEVKPVSRTALKNAVGKGFSIR